MALGSRVSSHAEVEPVGAVLLAGAANVIMQLAHPAVGHGVVESKVEGGQLFEHPVKRTRTTLAYIAVVALGSPRERELFRHGVNRAHAQVRSTPSSPVAYNAFDRDLQLWVAACLYKGGEDTDRYFGHARSPEQAEAMYRHGARYGTTLQVPEEMWPPDRAAFQAYWDAAVERIAIDDTVRDYLYDLTMLRYLPWPVSRALGPLHRFLTTGFLPPRFREEMRLPWSDARQRRFDAWMSAVGVVVRHLPPALRRFPFNALLWDLRWRIRTGRPLV